MTTQQPPAPAPAPAPAEQLRTLIAVTVVRNRAARRRTHCPAGRPIFRHDDLPAEDLATRSMLRRRRRRPAVGQQPVASYYCGPAGHRYVPLYAVAGSVEMPPLPPARQAAWNAVRTCAGCGTTATAPYAKGLDGQRYCGACQEPAAERWWHAERARERAVSTAWAREVLADPATVLAGSSNTWSGPRVVVEYLDGSVRLDVTVRRHPSPALRLHADEWQAATDPAALVGAARALDRCRIVTWRSVELRSLAEVLRDACEVDLGLRAAAGDVFGERCRRWRGWPSEIGPQVYRHNPPLAWPAQPDDPAEAVAEMRRALAEMAATGEMAAAPVVGAACDGEVASGA